MFNPTTPQEKNSTPKLLTVLYYVLFFVFLSIGALLILGDRDNFIFLIVGLIFSAILCLPVLHNLLRKLIHKRFVGFITSLLVIPVLILSFIVSAVGFYRQNPQTYDNIVSKGNYNLANLTYCGQGSFDFNNELFKIQEISDKNALGPNVIRVNLQPTEQVNPYKSMVVYCLEDLDNDFKRTNEELIASYDKQGIKIQMENLDFVKIADNITTKQFSFQDDKIQKVFVILTSSGDQYMLRTQSSNFDFDGVIKTANFKISIES